MRADARFRRTLAALGLSALPGIPVLAGCQRPTDTAHVVQGLHATPGGVDLLTFHGDNARTGWNRHETVLTPENVVPETFGLIATAADVEDEITGSPLFASDLPVHDGRSGMDTRADTVLVGTMNNRVFALDADNLGTLWSFAFEGHNGVWADDLQHCQGHYDIGVMSTPVLSPDKSTLYVVGRVAGATPTDTWLQGYALRTRDGSIAARFRVGETVNAAGHRTPIAMDTIDHGHPVRLTFTTGQYTQRAALLLVGGRLYVSTGGICDTPGFRGWLLAYDTAHLAESAPPVAVYLPTPNGGGGMWSAGGAASDGTSLWASVGNGLADLRRDTAPANRSISDALVRLDTSLRLDSTACFATATPSAACGAMESTNLRNVFLPRNAELLARDRIDDPMNTNGDVGDPDEDFGSAGALLVPPAELPENAMVDGGRSLAAVGGKDGFFYLLDRDHLGGAGPSVLHAEADIPALVGSELYARELFMHSTSGGIREGAAYFETHSGRYLYVMGADEIGRADGPRGVAAVRLVTVTDPAPEACAAQFRTTAYNNTRLGCSTIWGASPRPGYELAWSGDGPLNGASPVVSSNGYDHGIVWVTFEDLGGGHGLLAAYPADAGPGTGHVQPAIYRSDRVPSDAVPGTCTTFASPVVANGRVYVAGATFISVYGPLPRRVLPPVTPVPPPPDCAPGVSWESMAQPFMTHYCTSCHTEYNDIGFIQRRHDRVAASIAPTDGSAPSMPLQRDGMPVPSPTDAERATMAAWLRCGAPANTARMHAGYEVVAAPGGAFVGDGSALDPNQQGVLSGNRLMATTVSNPYAPAVPDGVFSWDRTGPTEVRLPVPGMGHYAVTMYFADMTCAADGTGCEPAFNVTLGGHALVTGLNVGSAAGGGRRAIARRLAVDLPATPWLTVDVSAGGRFQAVEAVRTGPCTGAMDCPHGFVCTAGVCTAGPDDPPPGPPPAYDGGVGTDAGGTPGTDATVGPRDGSATMDGTMDGTVPGDTAGGTGGTGGSGGSGGCAVAQGAGTHGRGVAGALAALGCAVVTGRRRRWVNRA